MTEPTNFLIAALAPEERRRLDEVSTLVDLVKGDTLCQAGMPIEDVYFPVSGVVSVIAGYEDGSTIEMATIGREGFAGVIAALEAYKELNSYIVQAEGQAYVIKSNDFKWLLAQSPAFKSLINRYIQAYLFQLLVSGACNGIHRVDQRLARWLLMMDVRTDGNELRLTQDFLAGMLGVHRPSVSLAAAILQEKGIISYSRGRILIKDRPALRAASCECFSLVEKTYAQLIGKPPEGDEQADRETEAHSHG